MRALFPKIDLLKYQRVIRMLSSLSGTIIKKSEVQAIINSVAEVYAQQTAHTLKVHQVKIAQGTHIK